MSTQRAFVIQFQPRTAATPERFEGRVEHVASGAAKRFASPVDLVDFVNRLLGPPAREADRMKGESGLIRRARYGREGGANTSTL